MSEGADQPKFKMQWDGRITPTFIMAGAQFLAVAFVGGMMWSALNRDIVEAKVDLVELKQEQSRIVLGLRAEITRLREQSTTIAVLQNDVTYIKSTITRIEQSLSLIQRRTDLPFGRPSAN